MTNFKYPVYVGDPPTGIDSTDTRGWVATTKDVTVSAAARKKQVTIPANSAILLVDGVVVSAVAGIAQGIVVNVGTSAAATNFAIINGLNAVAQVNGTLQRYVFNAGAVPIMIEATASVAASAADITAFKINVRMLYYTRSA